MDISSSDETSKKMEISASLNSVNDEDLTAVKNDFEKATMINLLILKESTENEAQPMEILQENNNDPSNKMDIEKSNENIIDNDYDNDNKKEILETPVNPKPGCSKDSDSLEKSQISETGQDKETLEVRIRRILTKNSSSFEKSDLLMEGQENFKGEVFQLFGEQSLMRGDGEDVFVTATNSKESANQNHSGKLTSREEMRMITNNSADDEKQVLKKRIITHGNNTLVVPAENSIQPPSRPAADNESPRVYGEHKYDQQKNCGKAEPQLPPRPPERDFQWPINSSNLPRIPIASIDEAQAETQSKAPAKEKNEYCQEMYTELCSIFPNMKKEYIKSMTPAEWAPNVGHALQIAEIVEKLLASEAAWQLEDPEDDNDDFIGAAGGTDVNSEKIDEIYERLLKRFPKADPTELRARAELVYNNDNQAFQEFIDPDHSTLEKYMQQMRTTEEHSSYTENFTVEGFLEKFPDPFEHFLDNERQCQYNPVVFEFLKWHFKEIQISTISDVYKDSDWNMSIAASKLAEIGKIGSEMSIRREDAYTPPKDINLLQEIAFVRHQEAIKEHIARLEEAEKLEFEALRKSNELLECQCCYDNECMPSKCSKCENGHIFCNSCITKATDTRLGDGETHVPCFQACDSEFSLLTLKKILKPKKYSILLKKRKAAELAAAKLEGYVECPFCYFASILPPNIKVFKCLNPKCMKESCVQCKGPNHLPLRCDEIFKSDEPLDLHYCNRCKRGYVKEGGCNKMNCPCGAIICYVCDKEIEGYSHFRRQDGMFKCALLPSNRPGRLVIGRAANEARRGLLRQDPRLNDDEDFEYLLFDGQRDLARRRAAYKARMELLLRRGPGLNIDCEHLVQNVPGRLAGRIIADAARREPLRQDPGLNIDVENLLLDVLQQVDGLRQQVLQALRRLRMPNLNQDVNQGPAGQGPR